MYYKVIKDNKVIDVINQLVLLKYLPNRKAMTVCELNEAQAILSSDGNTIWHEKTLNKMPVDGYETVEIQRIDQYEYNELVKRHLLSYEDLYDSIILSLIEREIL